MVTIPLEIATGKLSRLEAMDHPIIRLRIEQAMERHPDLNSLLMPVLKELDDHSRSIRTAKAAISTAKAMLKKLI